MRLKVGADAKVEFFRYLTGGRTDQARVVEGAMTKKIGCPQHLGGFVPRHVRHLCQVAF